MTEKTQEYIDKYVHAYRRITFTPSQKIIDELLKRKFNVTPNVAMHHNKENWMKCSIEMMEARKNGRDEKGNEIPYWNSDLEHIDSDVLTKEIRKRGYHVENTDLVEFRKQTLYELIDNLSNQAMPDSSDSDYDEQTDYVLNLRNEILDRIDEDKLDETGLMLDDNEND